jgi:N-glycosylase/DNA lyase
VLRRKEALPEGVAELAIGVRKGRLLVDGALPSAELSARITRMLQLDVDISEFLSKARASESHSWLEGTGFGRLLCGTTVWEDVVKVIATTNIQWGQTVRMVSLLVEKCGRGGAFPEPAEVARFRVEELQEDCRLGYRAKGIHAVATGIVSGTIDLAKISDRAQSTDELFRSYLTLPAIGPYGAAHLLAMDGRHDLIAVDTEFRRFVRETYHGGRAVKDATMLRRYAKWGKWKYLAYWSEIHRSMTGGG